MQYEADTLIRREMCEAILKRCDRLIVAQVHHLNSRYPGVTQQAVLDLEIDELVQRARIKFWQALEKRDIRSPYSYLQLIVRSEFIDMARRKRTLLPLPTEEDWIYDGLGTPPVPDPADDVEQRMEASARLKETIQAVLTLPPRQRLAMICSLRDRVDDLVQLSEAFKMFSVDIKTIRWPADKAQKQLLLASLAPARRSLSKKMKRRSG